jgi:hypothetical protein
MRDVDVAGYGHNTTFLSRIANNVLSILTAEQKQSLIDLAKVQEPIYENFAYNRFPLMSAFRRTLAGDLPDGSTGLSVSAVSLFTADLYRSDADLCVNRAIVVGNVIHSFTDAQKASFAAMAFDDYDTWPDVPEDQTLKRGLTNTQFVAVMTYASELFSWYKGGITADVYFCPERHGTYFGGFFMKDYPAMNDPDYFISTTITGDKGKAFLQILNEEQRALVTGIVDAQRLWLQEVASIRREVSVELRKAMEGVEIDTDMLYAKIGRYGELDGLMSALYAQRFAAVNATLNETQRAALVALRDLDAVPTGAYAFSTPIDMPSLPDISYLFGVGDLPSDAGRLPTPPHFIQ